MGVSWAATRLLTQKDSVEKDTENPNMKKRHDSNNHAAGNNKYGV